MNIKLKDAHFDVDTGISYATIITEIGEFSGTSKLHEEDKQISSNFAGCEYAEWRAIIKYMKRKKYLLNYEIKAIKDMIKILENRKDYEPNHITNRKLRQRQYILQKQYKEWERKISSLKDRMYKNMQDREKVIEHLMKKENKEMKEENESISN